MATNPIWDAIRAYHIGDLQVVLDVGCGTGATTRFLANLFNKAYGCDNSPEMINLAREQGGEAGEKPISYRMASAEKLGHYISPGSVDLLVAAKAAEWFNMPLFWQQAARLVDYRGTVALWVTTSGYCHPSTHNAEEVQKILRDYEQMTSRPYEPHALHIAKGLYDDLVLPWKMTPPPEEFVEADYVRHEWNRDGVVAPGEHYFNTEPPYTTSLETLESTLETADSTQNWRDDNPELAGTDEDCVKVTMRKLHVALGGRKEFELGGGTVLLLFRRAETVEYVVIEMQWFGSLVCFRVITCVCRASVNVDHVF